MKTEHILLLWAYSGVCDAYPSDLLYDIAEVCFKNSIQIGQLGFNIRQLLNTEVTTDQQTQIPHVSGS